MAANVSLCKRNSWISASFKTLSLNFSQDSSLFIIYTGTVISFVFFCCFHSDNSSLFLFHDSGKIYQTFWLWHPITFRIINFEYQFHGMSMLYLRKISSQTNKFICFSIKKWFLLFYSSPFTTCIFCTLPRLTAIQRTDNTSFAYSIDNPIKSFSCPVYLRTV